MEIKIYSIIFLILVTGKCFAEDQTDTSAMRLSSYQMQPIHMHSRWAKEVSPTNALKEYPRPQMERKNWENINGLWEYAILDSAKGFPKGYDGTILVPYPIESSLSGVQKKLLPHQRLWYKKNLKAPLLTSNERLMLNFGGIDWQATIFLNKKEITTHKNGYQSFSTDITDYLQPGNNELLVEVYDPSDQGLNPHGKQVLNPQNIYYTPSSGIWQTVWLEKIPRSHISNVRTAANIDKKELSIQVNTTGNTVDMMLEATAIANGKIVAIIKEPIKLHRSSEFTSSLKLLIPNVLLWSPDSPFLYDLSLKLKKGNKTIDEIKSYFGMRKIDIQKDEKGVDRIFLNNKYTYNLGVLDQGFWPEGLYTAPTDEALAFDIKAIKAMGFNTIRKHIKIEPERWYYHADKIGVLVWQDFVNPPQGIPDGAKEIFEKEIRETIDQLYSHPCIVTWVLFNERWGSYDQKRLTQWVKNYDPNRLVNGHSGELLYVNDQLREPADSPWVNSDMTDVHSYPEPRNPPGMPGKAKVLGEFGGIGVPVSDHEWDDMQGWGYIQVTPAVLKDKYEHMNQSLKKLERSGLSASIYTQPFDVEGEENGLLTYDREIIKIPLNELRSFNKELVTQTDGFKIDPGFKIAANIDVNNNDNQYSELSSLYQQGKRDSAFLRRLTLMAIRLKDQPNATVFGNSYIEILVEPNSRENLTFIRKITRTSRDKGFQIFNTEPERINKILGKTLVEYKVKSIINSEELDPYLASANNPNWDSIQHEIATKFGALGEELVLGKRMLYYLNGEHNWKKFGEYYMLYFRKALKRPEYIINNITWSVFEHVDDPEILKFALEVMKYDLETWDQNNSQAYDTYANLLHKVNKSSEAIKWEEKAIQLKVSDEEGKTFAETLQKMKSGQPTWPTNN